jgi:putative heme-binding domain-containing protein
LLFYLGDNWPAQYHNTLLTVNFHGRRLNNELVERLGSGYTARHGEDIFKTEDIWFRGLDLITGPDGGVFVSDWSDVGECHNADGVHRTSGRIYKLSYGQPAAPETTDVAALSTLELCRIQSHANDWFPRHARRILQERAAADENMGAARHELKRLFESDARSAHKLRYLWSLYVIGGADEEWLLAQLHHENEHVRAWAVRLLVDQGAPSEAAEAEFVKLARIDASGLVRLYLASALQRMPENHRVALAEGLASHAEDANDHNMPLMIWYGIEPVVNHEPETAVALAGRSAIPLLGQYTARWFAEKIETDPGPLNALLAAAFGTGTEAFQREVVRGVAEGLHGWRKAPRPSAWDKVVERSAAWSDADGRERVRHLSLLFGDGRALTEVRAVALNSQEAAEARIKAIQALIESRPDDLQRLLTKLVTERTVGVVAAKGLMSFDDADAQGLILRQYGRLSAEERGEVVEALISRRSGARQLLAKVSKGEISRGDISPFHARQIKNLGDAQLSTQLAEVWGEIRGTSEEKRKFISKYRGLLTPERLKAADASRGRALFNQSCALCHVLYGEGARIGPDLTGSARENLDYLLENIVDPSAIVGAEYRVSIVTMKDGRALNGILRDPTAKTFTIQSPGTSLTVERSEVAGLETSALSLMPEGLLEGLRDDQAADLIRYLMSREQVAVAVPAK